MTPLVLLCFQDATISPAEIDNCLAGIKADWKGPTWAPITSCRLFARTFAMIRYMEFGREMG